MILLIPRHKLILYVYFQLELPLISSIEFEWILNDFFSCLLKGVEGVGWVGGEGQHLMARVSSYKKVHCTVLIEVGDRIANHNDQL